MTKEHLSDGRQAEEFEMFLWQHTNMCDIDLISEVAEVLAEAEYRKQRIGQWEISKIGDGGTTRTCSNCHISQTVNVYNGKVMFKFCPYCGARMKGGDQV